MADENLSEASAPEMEPATTEPVTESEAAPAAEPEAPATEEAPTDESQESTEASPEASEDDPFAEFETTAVNSRSDYERLFESDPKLKHTPHAARALVYAEAEKREVIEQALNSIGGMETLDTFRPTFEAVLNPDPTQEQVDAAFESLNNHNPKVLEKLGAGFTREWVNEVVADPVTNLTPLIVHTFSQLLGPGAQEYDLNRLAELVQLDMARDVDGDPILDLDTARQMFEMNGGFNAFKFQQERAEWQKEKEQLTNGFQQRQPQQAQTTQTFDVDADLEKEILPQYETVVTRLGYKKEDPEFGFIMDAMKYRLRHAPETERIRVFAKNGTYKTEDGSFVQGVTNNKSYLTKRLFNELVGEMKVFQSKRKGAPATPKEITKPASTQAPVTQKTTAPANTNVRKSVEDIAAEAAANARKRFSDHSAANAVAAGN